MKKPIKELGKMTRSNGILIRNKKDKKLSWEETFKQIALEKENWNDLDTVITDGIIAMLPN